jgi:hypothetical protein
MVMMLARVHVNYRPLNGNWDGTNWDQQDARCSNNFMSGPHPPVPPAGVTAIRWDIESSEASSIAYNVSVDLPDDDDILFPGQRDGVVTTYLRTMPAAPNGGTGPWYRTGLLLADYYKRGIYIAGVYGATGEFYINVVGLTSADLIGGTISRGVNRVTIIVE